MQQVFDREKVYEQLYCKHFKKYYKGKPTKRYLKVLGAIKGVSIEELLINKG